MLAVVLCSYRLDGFVAALCALNTVVNLALIELFDDRFLRSTAPDIEQGKWHACARVSCAARGSSATSYVGKEFLHEFYMNILEYTV